MQDAIGALSSMTEKSLDLLALVGRKHNPYRIRILQMFSTLFDMTKDYILLLERRRFIIVPLILRSAMDTLVDLKLLLSNPDNIYHVEAQRLKRQKEALEYEMDIDSLATEKSSSDRDQSLFERHEALARDLEDLKVKGYAPLSERAKFEKAGMVDLYRTYFLAFSMESHNNAAALDSRHLVRDEKGDLLVLFDRVGTDNDFEMWTSLVAIFYVEATRVVSNLLSVDGTSFLKPMLELVASHISPKYEAIFTFLGEQAAG